MHRFCNMACHRFQKEESQNSGSDLPELPYDIKNPSGSFTYNVKAGEFCFTCGFQCSAFEHWQLTGRKWEVSAEGQTKRSKACFSLQAEGKRSKGKGCGRVKHSSHCADGLRIFIKPTRHRIRRALLKNVVPRWTESARFIYYRAASS